MSTPTFYPTMTAEPTDYPDDDDAVDSLIEDLNKQEELLEKEKEDLLESLVDDDELEDDEVPFEDDALQGLVEDVEDYDYYDYDDDDEAVLEDDALGMGMGLGSAGSITRGPTIPPTVAPTIPPTIPPTVAPTMPPTIGTEEPTFDPTYFPSSMMEKELADELEINEELAKENESLNKKVEEAEEAFELMEDDDYDYDDDDYDDDDDAVEAVTGVVGGSLDGVPLDEDYDYDDYDDDALEDDGVQDTTKFQDGLNQIDSSLQEKEKEMLGEIEKDLINYAEHKKDGSQMSKVEVKYAAIGGGIAFFVCVIIAVFVYYRCFKANNRKGKSAKTRAYEDRQSLNLKDPTLAGSITDSSTRDQFHDEVVETGKAGGPSWSSASGPSHGFTDKIPEPTGIHNTV